MSVAQIPEVVSLLLTSFSKWVTNPSKNRNTTKFTFPSFHMVVLKSSVFSKKKKKKNHINDVRC